jgi:hypothetical protein
MKLNIINEPKAIKILYKVNESIYVDYIIDDK